MSSSNIQWKKFLKMVMAGIFVFLLLPVARVQAEGSVNMYPVGYQNPATNQRISMEWRETAYGNLLQRRTFVQIYARAGEVINLGSSAKGVGLGDIALWAPDKGIDTFEESQRPYPANPASPTAAELPAATLLCSSQANPAGQITSRTQELAGPLPNSGGYTPCTYIAPETGVYWVAFWGPLGPKSNTDPGDDSTVSNPSIASDQNSGISMWDATVRSSDEVITYSGRVFTSYYTGLTGANGINYRSYSTLYGTTSDGFIYQADMRGLDGNGFMIYNNNVGFFNADNTPLYHDLYDGTNNQLTAPQGGVTLAQPTGLLFFQYPSADIPASIVPIPQKPSVDNVAFVGTRSGNTTYFDRGGDFYYYGNIGGIAEVIISRNGTNFDPTNALNRVLRAESYAGTNVLHWDGLDNSGAAFPTGTFNFQVNLHAGEYHFPLLDVENSSLGGPTITMLNPIGGTCPFATCSHAFYDDRCYLSSNGSTVSTGCTIGNTIPTGNVAPNPNASSALTGFDTSTTARSYGDGSGAGWGDKKGLDLWTYFPSSYVTNNLVIFKVPKKTQDLAIVMGHVGDFEVGSQGEYAITVTSVASWSFQNPVTVSNTLPAGLSFHSASGTGWTCSAVGNVVTCTHPNTEWLAPGVSLPDISITVDILSTVAATVTNTAIITTEDARSDNNSMTDMTYIKQFDFGDLPASFSNTIHEDDGARHQLGNLYLGTSIDAENVGSNSADGFANADDNNGDDEDGLNVSSGQTWTPGATVNLEVNVHGDNGYLVGWFDWNKDGSFGDGEEYVFGFVNYGLNTVSLVISDDYVGTSMLPVRLRLYSGLQDLPKSTGAVVNGEVEDYFLPFNPTAVELIDFKASTMAAPLALYLLGGGLALGLLGLALLLRRR